MNETFNRVRYSSLITLLLLNLSTCASLKMSLVPIATYEEVKDLPNHPEKLLIDVREPAEIAETGSIPTSINIPCKFDIVANIECIRRIAKYYLSKWVKFVALFLMNYLIASLKYFIESRSPS